MPVWVGLRCSTLRPAAARYAGAAHVGWLERGVRPTGTARRGRSEPAHPLQVAGGPVRRGTRGSRSGAPEARLPRRRVGGPRCTRRGTRVTLHGTRPWQRPLRLTWSGPSSARNRRAVGRRNASSRRSRLCCSSTSLDADPLSRVARTRGRPLVSGMEQHGDVCWGTFDGMASGLSSDPIRRLAALVAAGVPLRYTSCLLAAAVRMRVRRRLQVTSCRWSKATTENGERVCCPSDSLLACCLPGR